MAGERKASRERERPVFAPTPVAHAPGLPEQRRTDMARWPLRLMLALSIYSQVQAQSNTISETPIRMSDRAHWAFQPPRRPEVPKVARTSWVRTPVDSYILSRLEAAGLS